MATSGSGTGTPITPIPPAGVGGGGTGTAVVIGCATGTPTVIDQCLCRHCQPEAAYTSLESWRMAMQCIEPWQFWGWDNDDLRKFRAKTCQDIALERTGRGFVGRSDIRTALLQAENEFLANLKYPVVPTWFQEQLHPNKLLQARHKYVTKLGAPVRTVLGTAQRESQSVTFLNYDPEDGDVITFSASQANAKWPDTFTLSIARPADLTDASEVALYIFTDDRYEQKSNHARWRIEPIDVTLTNAAIIITGRSWLLAKPELYNVWQSHSTPISAFGNFSLDPSYMPNYVERLEVARLTVNQCDAGLIRTESTCTCSGCTCEFDENGVPTHCHTCTEIDLCIENARFGLIRPLYPQLNLWNLSSDSLLCQGDPKSVCIHYQAGDCSRDWTQDIAILATTYLHNICDCTFPCLTRWWEDKAQGENKQNTFESLNNPFGTLAGQVATWKTIERHKWPSVTSW